jgi:uncharacterized circularly permuted ATP-grasp superfamily protein/menaquinone-dependent protoporphyrinogen IX oxidase
VRDNKTTLDDYKMKKKDLDEIVKNDNGCIEDLVILPGEEKTVVVDMRKLAESILTSDKMDKKTLARENDRLEEFLRQQGITIDLSNVKQGDEEQRLKKLRDILVDAENEGLITTTQMTVSRKDVEDICQKTKKKIDSVLSLSTVSPAIAADKKKKEKVKKEKIQNMKPTDTLNVDPETLIDTILLGKDKLGAAVVAKEAEKLTQWLKEQGIEVNVSDLKPGDDVGKLKRILSVVRDNKTTLDDYKMKKKDLDEIVKNDNGCIEDLVILPGEEKTVVVDMRKLAESILTSDKMDKKTLARENDRLEEFLRQQGITIDLSNVKQGDEEQRLKKLRDILVDAENEGLITTTQMTVSRKDVEDICQKTKKKIDSVLSLSTVSPAIAADKKKKEKVKKEKIQNMKPTDTLNVDPETLIDTILLGKDKLGAAVVAKEAEKLTQWLKEQGIEVNVSDLKPGDDVGKLKRILSVVRDNKTTLDDYKMKKKDLDEIVKNDNGCIEDLVILPGEEKTVVVDMRKLAESILTSDKMDKKTLARENDRLEEFLRQQGITIDLSNVKQGDEEQRLKKLRDILVDAENEGLITTTQMTVSRKDVEDICQKTKKKIDSVLSLSTVSPAIAADKKKKEKVKKEKIQNMKPTDTLNVDPETLIDTILLGKDKLGAAVVAKEAEKLTQWLKEQGIEVNVSDLKPGDDVGKLKRILSVVRDNKTTLDDYKMKKKDLDEIVKNDNGCIEDLVILPGEEKTVVVDMRKLAESILTSDKMDKKTLARENDRLEEFLRQQGITIDLSNVKQGDEEQRLKKLRDILVDAENEGLITTTQMTVSRKDVEDICQKTKKKIDSVLSLSTVSPAIAADKKKKEKVKKEKIQNMKPTDTLNVDPETLIDTILLGKDKLGAAVVAKEAEKLTQWLKEQGIEVNVSDLKPGDHSAKLQRILHTIRRHPHLSPYYQLIQTLTSMDQLSLLSVLSPPPAAPQFEFTSPYSKIPSEFKPPPEKKPKMHTKSFGSVIAPTSTSAQKTVTKINYHEEIDHLPTSPDSRSQDNSSCSPDSRSRSNRVVRPNLTENSRLSWTGASPRPSWRSELTEPESYQLTPETQTNLRLVVDLLRSNHLPEEALILQLEKLVTERVIRTQGAAAALPLMKQLNSSDRPKPTLENLQSIASKYNIALEDLATESIEFRHETAKLLEKNYAPLVALLKDYPVKEIDKMPETTAVTLLCRTLSTRTSIPMMNYLIHKLNEHPSLGPYIRDLCREEGLGATSPVILNRLLQMKGPHAKEQNARSQWLMLMKAGCRELDEIISSLGESLSSEELFEYLSLHHPYKLERILNDHRINAGMKKDKNIFYD